MLLSPHLYCVHIFSVTGPSGSGKSSVRILAYKYSPFKTLTGNEQFINQVFGCKVAEVHDELESCTQTVRAFGCMHPHQTGQKVIIVDTPGFDDSNRTDFEILEELAQWLENTYILCIRLKLTSLIFLLIQVQTKDLGFWNITVPQHQRPPNAWGAT